MKRQTLAAGLRLGLAALITGAMVLTLQGCNAEAQTDTATDEENALELLHSAAVAEGGKLTVYIGGDSPTQQDALKTAFSLKFPDVALNLVVDLSKYHDARIDNQLATQNLVADVAILQTSHDFERWKADGTLLQYKPIGWDKVFDDAKDADGYWTGVQYLAFTPLVPLADYPDPNTFKATDLLQAKYKDKVILTYPNDDDAVLFSFKLLVDKYGWSWLSGLAAQNPTMVRGVPSPAIGVSNGTYLASLATISIGATTASPVYESGDPFVSWAQRGAIFAAAKHPAAAKMFLSWYLSLNRQTVIAQSLWSVRSDAPLPPGRRALSTYTATSASAFPAFMRDRATAERWRSQIGLYFGDVVGVDPASPSQPLGLTPGQF